MNIIQFAEDGGIDVPPAFFEDWIIDNTLSRAIDYLSSPSHRSLEWRFRTAAASLAADAFAARLDWESVSANLVRVSRDVGIAQEQVPAQLAVAWSWGSSNPTRWMNLSRSWVFNLEHGLFVNVISGVSIDALSFDGAFAEKCPLPGWAMSEFLINEGLVIEVDRLVHDVTVAKRFLHIGDVIILNCPQGVLAP